nr:hypothetical protein [Tanacetum cinerariifolium]
KSVKKPVKRKVWKSTGKVFKIVGYKWKPTRRTFTNDHVAKIMGYGDYQIGNFRAASFKASLSFTLIATVALLIIVVVVAVGVVVIVVVVVIGVVVIVAVVFVGVVVVGICRSASTVPGQMANPFTIIAPRWARTFMMVITLGT